MLVEIPIMVAKKDLAKKRSITYNIVHDARSPSNKSRPLNFLVSTCGADLPLHGASSVLSQKFAREFGVVPIVMALTSREIARA